MNRKEKIKEKLWCEALLRGHAMQYRALGGSMSPSIKSGDILSVKPDNRISIGDVILYKRGECFTAHRVVGKRKIEKDLFFLTKGDALRSCDGLVNPSEVLGKVVTVRTRKGKIMEMDSFLRRILNRSIAVVSPFFLARIMPTLRKAKAVVLKKKSNFFQKQVKKEKISK